MMATRSRLTILSLATLMALSAVCAVTAEAQAQALPAQSGGEMIAFIRNGDIWTMSPDGSNQRPLVAGIQNAKYSISWEPGNKRLAFTRSGILDLKYPDGGGGKHSVYDLFYAFLDSTNNFWMGFTETLGALYPDWSDDGKTIAFTYDKNALVSNAVMPDYQVGFYDIKSRVIRSLDMPPYDEPLMARAPSLSPNGSRVAFALARFDGKAVVPIGIAITSANQVTQPADELIQQASKLSDGTAPSWSPDGEWIAYISTDMSNQAIYLIRPDYTDNHAIWKASAGIGLPGSPPSWSPDSKKLAFGASNGAVYTIGVDGSNPTLISGPGSDEFPSWSK